MRNLCATLTTTLLAIMLMQPAASAGEKKPAAKPAGPEMFQKNVRLDIWLIPLEDGDEGTFVITATPDFAAWVEFSNEAISITFKISGQIKITDDGRFFVEYKIATTFESPQGDGGFGTQSSAILEADQELSVSHIGEKTLVLRASFKLDEDKE